LTHFFVKSTDIRECTPKKGTKSCWFVVEPALSVQKVVGSTPMCSLGVSHTLPQFCQVEKLLSEPNPRSFARKTRALPSELACLYVALRVCSYIQGLNKKCKVNQNYVLHLGPVKISIFGSVRKVP
jgi:hypothetical protein